MSTGYTLWLSPGACSRVSLTALEECGVEYDSNLVPLLKGANKTPEFLALNAKGKVPLLRTPQGLLSENIAIVGYLATRHPQAHLLPIYNPWAQAQAQSLMSWCASTLHSMIYRIRMTPRVCDMVQAQPRVKELAMAELAAQLAVAETRLADGIWLLGETWSMADNYLWWVWSRATDSGLDAAVFPRLVEHARRVAKRPATVRALEREAVAVEVAV